MQWGGYASTSPDKITLYLADGVQISGARALLLLSKTMECWKKGGKFLSFPKVALLIESPQGRPCVSGMNCISKKDSLSLHGHRRPALVRSTTESSCAGMW